MISTQAKVVNPIDLKNEMDEILAEAQICIKMIKGHVLA